MPDTNSLALGLRAMTVFRALRKDPIICSMLSLFEAPKDQMPLRVGLYADLAAALFERGDNLSDAVLQAALTDDNLYMIRRAQGLALPDAVTRCAVEELRLLEKVSRLTCDELREATGYGGFLPEWRTSRHDFVARYHDRLQNIGEYGYGDFARYHAFAVGESGVVPIARPDPVTLDQLSGYDRERSLVVQNTLSLLRGEPAANVLLYGDSGTGKSSTVKAVVNAYRHRGLRLIELKRDQLRRIAPLLDSLGGNPLKFVLFIDDLSFSRDDENYAALKAALEGSVSFKSGNVVIYATSNRRHLVKESFSDRAGDEIHLGDTIAELTSLSDRFGLTVTFSRPDRDLYLRIVSDIAGQSGVALSDEELFGQAEAFALRHAGRSPRVARQFVDSLIARR